jgi:hypothetical protein
MLVAAVVVVEGPLKRWNPIAIFLRVCLLFPIG